MSDELVSGYSVDYRNNNKTPIYNTLKSNENNKKHKPTKVIAKSNFVNVKKYNLNKSGINNLNKSSDSKTFFRKRNVPWTKSVTIKSKNKVKLNIKYIIVIKKIIISVLLLLLTLLGLIIVINRFSSLKDSPVAISVSNSIPEINYSEFLAPIVMHDPEPFKDPSKADNQMKISSSIWRCIMKNGTNKYNNFDDRGFSLIPVAEVKSSCTELFGPNNNVNFNERVFGPFYSLDAGEENFHISASSNYNSYIPYIKDIKKDRDSINLTVGYVLREDPFFSKTGNNKEGEPTIKKCMIYKLKENPETKRFFVQEISIFE